MNAAPMESLSISEPNGSHHIRLACQACQRKKIKCDRTFPCGQCQRSGIQCFQSTRKPRVKRPGKRGGDSELRSRISKLESLVESLSGEVGSNESHNDGGTTVVSNAKPSSPGEEHHEAPSPSVKKLYIGSPFWASLTDEVQGLRDALDEDASDDEHSPASPVEEYSMASLDHNFLIFPPSSVHVMPNALPDPSPSVLRQIQEIFLKNVDPVFKFLHRPSIEHLLVPGGSYLGHRADHPANKALRAAIWFSAIASITDAECLNRFQTSRVELLRLYRRHVGVALAKVDLVITNDIAALQATVLFTGALRVTDLTRRAWTMTALVVRIAYGIGLHREISTDSPYMKEIKRRTWHQIRFLDIYAAVDRGTEALIRRVSFDTPLPSNVNDNEFDESTTSIIGREEGLTDMAFNLMSHSATDVVFSFLVPEDDSTKGETWQQRLDKALELGKTIQQKFLQYCDFSIPYHRFLHHTGNSMCASTLLRAIRPLQHHVASVPPRVDSPFVLQVAMNNLRVGEASYVDPELEGWRWIVFVQWHALAVALAGLCSVRDTELADTAWQYVERAYDRHSTFVAEGTGGMLWRPLQKLYKKARAFRDGAPAGSSASPPSSSDMRMASNQSMPGIATGLSTSAGVATTYDSSPLQAQAFSSGNMPYSEPMNTSLDVSGTDAFGTTAFTADMTWQDWEQIMEDMKTDMSYPNDLDEMQVPLDVLQNYTYQMHGTQQNWG